MTIGSGLVLFAVIWTLVFFVVLPLRLRTQDEDGNVVPGTPSSAPTDPQLGRKARLTTIWAVAIWAVIAAVIVTGAITVRDFDVMGRMPPASGSAPADDRGE